MPSSSDHPLLDYQTLFAEIGDTILRSGICRLNLDAPLSTKLALEEQIDFLYAHVRVGPCNQALAKIYRLDSPAALAGSRLGSYFMKPDTDGRNLLRRFITQGYRLEETESREVLAGGDIRFVAHTLSGVVADDVLLRIWSVQHDVTRLKMTEEDNQRLAAFARESPYPILECDERGFPVYVNPSTRSLLDRLSVDLQDLLPANHPDIIAACLHSGESTGDIEVQVAGYTYNWTYQPAPAAKVVHLYGVDVTDLRRVRDRLERNALEDELTGLPNRALLLDRLERNADLMRRHADYHFAVLLLDLDRFKLVNESLGHAVGDRLLVEVSRRLRACVKPSDTLARTGGDEFIILIEDIGSPGNATRIAERIGSELAQAFVVENQEFFLSASVGISLSDARVDLQPADLLRDAESAMYRAKTAGKNRAIVFDDGMHRQASDQLALEADLRQALDHDQLLLHYQPIVSISSMSITGFEALLRWRHPERGLVPPLDFIPLAEETGLIEAIGAWVLSSACRQAVAWHQAGHAYLDASVNLSARQFERKDLAEAIRHELETSGLPASRLKLEITESTAARDMAFAIQTLDRLHDLGVRVMVDDFGTGFSSLAQLKRFPVDVLKIDRSFVQDLDQDSANAAIVTTITSMAHALGFEVVAEGVETLAQLHFLRSQRCDYAQGYLLGRPVPAEEFTQLLQRGIQLP